jgi:hypothetical protein
MRALSIFVFFAVLSLSSCGGGVSGKNGSDPFNVNDTALNNTIKIGFFDQSGEFVEGQVGVLLTPVNGVFEISAGGSVGLNVSLVDADDKRVTEAYSVAFTSNCVTAQQALLNTDISTVNGEASSTYTDDGCASTSGNKDQVTVTVVTADSTLIATQEISIRPEAIGGISFSSSIPVSIELQSSSGVNPSQSTVTFIISNERAVPLANQIVEFSLTTEIGGLRLGNVSDVSDVNGEVSVEVFAGDIPISVRVNASVRVANGDLVTTQSDAIAVTTGLPNQQSFSIAPDTLNVEAGDFDGVTVNLIARLSDTFNNPVPDNTVVNFTTEGGVVESSCLTSAGFCAVTWTSTQPRPSNARVTVLATAIGHETLFDSNGNNIFDDADGGPIEDTANTQSGFGTDVFTQTGFIDHSEAWRDDNENGQRDNGELFLDYNDNQYFDVADGLFNGPQCQSAELLCGQGTASTILVRKSLVLIMSSSDALMDIVDESNTIISSNNRAVSQPSLHIDNGKSLSFRLRFSDTSVQPIASGSQIDISSSVGILTGQLNSVMPNTNKPGAREVNFSLTNDNDSNTPVDATITSIITSPSGIESSVIFQVTLN